MAISKICSLAVASLAKINSLAKLSVNKINSVAASFGTAFADAYAVGKSLTTGSSNAIYISNDNSDYALMHDEAWSISIWVKAGWSTSLNTNLHFWSSNEASGTSSADNMIRLYFRENDNRLYFGWRNGGYRKMNFWHFHDNSGVYADAYSAAGLGTSYWTAANRGNVGDNDFTMLTICKGASNTADPSNLDLYWNAADCGQGYYASGYSSGTPVMDNVDRRMAVGSVVWNDLYNKTGNSVATQYNDLTIWDKKLSAGEVSDLFNGGTRMDATTHSAASDLRGYYKFENDGADSSGNSNTAFTINGDSSFESL